MADIKRNLAYNAAFSAVRNLGDTLNRIKYTPPKTNNIVSTSNIQKNIPESLKGLGVQTTPYMGSTRFESKHPGIDFANKEGTPIKAGVSGKIVEVNKDTGRGFGNSVVVQDSNGNFVRWSHLNSAYVPVGSMVSTDTIIGGMGKSGSVYSNSGGSGVHTDLRIYNSAKRYFDPFSYLK